MSENTGLPPELEEDVNKLFINKTRQELEELIQLSDKTPLNLVFMRLHDQRFKYSILDSIRTDLSSHTH